MPDTSLPAGIGHNSITPARELLDDLRLYLAEPDATLGELARRIAEALPAQMSEQTGSLTSTTAELQQVMDLWDQHRPEIADDDQAEKATNFAQRLNRHGQAIEAWHKSTKAPFLAAGKLVDNTKQKLLGPVDTMKTGIVGRLNRYQARLAAQRRAEADRLRREALERERAAAAAEKAGDITAAIALEASAQQSAQAAAAVADSRPQVRTEHGAMATTRRTWDFEITDADAVPRELCRPADDLIKAVIKASDDPAKLSIAGVRVFERVSTLIR